MPPIDPHRRLKERDPSIKLLHTDGLVPTQRTRISAPRIQLTRSSETPHRLVVFLLQRERVPNGNPGLRGESIDGDEFLGEMGEGESVVKVPKEGGEDVHVLETVRVDGSSLEEGSFGLRTEEVE